ncbi:MAG: hypothetical protein K9J37_11400 [Saprospiraceae bacterium]|nr:hypothetical protein [Saprospiraceae bacterium]MCF8250511.1 hypothetical protein [Saprospiraceae bacterium]MCF8279651.1 hypothetical protein [Bacteroidales bacterium]MCF8312437.1 hypothetical protein [Saprospiraceae bacterium]MCF8440746.1 hypothetical protein [Saprospiraceae bacterium]
MAKKTFNIKSTLAVQPKQLSADDIETAIKQIHDGKEVANPLAAPKNKQVTSLTEKRAAELKPGKKSSRRGSREVVVEAPVRKVRLSVDIHPVLHKRLKIKAIEHDSDIMHYVEMLIARDLG